MKKAITLALILCFYYSSHSQDCFDKLAKQAILIDSLQKVVKTEMNMNQEVQINCQKISKILRDSIKVLKSDLGKLEEFKVEKKAIESRIRQKSDSITLLINQKSEINRQISIVKQNCEQKLIEEKEKIKNEALQKVIDNYKGKNFDDLIKTSTKLSVQRDIQLVGNNEGVRFVLLELERYFKTEDLVSSRFNADEVKQGLVQLGKNSQQSDLQDKLKENLKFYSDYNDELIKTINKLIELDAQKIAGDDAKIQKLKFEDILRELTDYMYNYYEFNNYKYLSDILFEVIKRKRQNADANISDLLIKLQ